MSQFQYIFWYNMEDEHHFNIHTILFDWEKPYLAIASLFRFVFPQL